jgi:hypothetical protein
MSDDPAWRADPGGGDRASTWVLGSAEASPLAAISVGPPAGSQHTCYYHRGHIRVPHSLPSDRCAWASPLHAKVNML